MRNLQNLIDLTHQNHLWERDVLDFVSFLGHWLFFLFLLKLLSVTSFSLSVAVVIFFLLVLTLGGKISLFGDGNSVLQFYSVVLTQESATEYLDLLL